MEQRDKGLATVAGAHEPGGVRSAALRARRRRPHASGAARAVASRCASPRTSLSTAPGLQMLARKSMESSVTGGWRELGMAERMPQGGLPLVLLAGDGQEGTRWLRVLLEGGGYAVLQERTAQHALERARPPEPDVILVDAELPDMAGVFFFQAEDGIRDVAVTGVQTCALPISEELLRQARAFSAEELIRRFRASYG